MKIALATFFLTVLTAAAVAQQVPDFSGTYTFKSSVRSDSRTSSYPLNPQTNAIEGRLITKVVQDSRSVEVVFRLPDGKSEVTYKYSLDGSEIQGAEPDGTPTVERAEIKGKHLIIRSSIKVTTGALKGAPIVRTEKWELSKDHKTLTVHQQTEIQGMHMADDLQTVAYVHH